MKYIVTAMNVNRQHCCDCGEMFVPKENEDGTLYIRDDVIDTNENALFALCQNSYEVEDCYEKFWNRMGKQGLNLSYQNRDVVKVLRVREAV